MAPSKAQQEAEAAARAKADRAAAAAGRPAPAAPGETAAATAGVEPPLADESAEGRPAPRTPDPPPVAAPPPVSLTPGDTRRAEMIGRFREDRTADDTEAAANTAELHKFTRGGIPPEIDHPETPIDPIAAEAAEDEAELEAFAAANRPPAEGAPEPEPEPEPEPAARPAAPVKHKLLVHGQEVEATLEEIIADAQKARAAQDILGEAKALLLEARSLRQPPSGPTGADRGADQPAESGQPPAEVQPADQGPDFRDLAETIQIGSVEEGAAKLQEMFGSLEHRLEQKLSGKATEDIRQDKLSAEINRSNRAWAQFVESNKDFMTNEDAAALGERQTYQEFLADLAKIGVTRETIAQQQQGRLPTARDIAIWHQAYRANQPDIVRSMDSILVAARDSVLERFPQWRPGEKPADPNPRPAVVVDRSERRMKVAPQPTRAATPRATPQQAPQIDRTAIAQKMIQDRATKRGRQVVA